MSRHQDLPLKSDIATRFVPKIVALMVYLGTLCFVFTLYMMQSIHSWESQLSTDLSIEIPILPGSSPQGLQARVLQLLNHTPGVHYAAAIPQKEISSLFHTLLGEDVDMDLFSLPIIIDVSLKDKEKVNISVLKAHLKNISPHIQLTDHRAWQAHVLNLTRTIMFIAFIVTILILIAALLTTSFAARTSLLIHRQIVEVLSLIGATNSYIAKQFQLNALKQGLIASIIGSFFAFLTFYGIGLLLKESNFAFVFSSSFFVQSLCVFALAPFLTAFAMMLSARYAIMKALRS